MVNNKSLLQFKKANCKNCYKCVRNCPVKAIRVKDQQARIIESQCILCEKCTIICPQNAKVELNQIPEIQNKIHAGKRMIASVHPAYLAQYPQLNFPAFRKSLIKLGFFDAYESAEGGALMKKQYERLLQSVCNSELDKKTIISSQCTVITLLIQRKYPELVPYLAKIPSMMEMHAAILKERFPDADIVYLSPCISTMAEMNEYNNHVSYVITFTELNDWFKQKRIDPLGYETDADLSDSRLSRGLAMGGGLSRAIKPVSGYRYIDINGIVNCIGVLDELKANTYENCFLELNACINGCVGGPSFRKRPIHLLKSLQAVMMASGMNDQPLDYDRDFITALNNDSISSSDREYIVSEVNKKELPDEKKLRAILEQMGKHSETDELNCGACGYNTCREKAIAISEGKAEISMCVPFMRERQESYSEKIIDAMPGLLVTVDYNLNIIHMNKAAKDLFDITRKRNLIGSPLSGIMDDYAVINMIAFNKRITQDQITLADGRTCLDRVMTNDRKNQLILCVMKDITKDQEERKRLTRAQTAAAEMADRLMEEQLRMVHQIAELLGETAADTKIAVERLKDTILQENETL